MIVYQLGPIDWWFGWTRLDKALAAAAAYAEESRRGLNFADGLD
jgi:hypothetical protein